MSHFGSQEKSASLSVTGYSACGARYFFIFLRPFASLVPLALKFFLVLEILDNLQTALDHFQTISEALTKT